MCDTWPTQTAHTQWLKAPENPMVKAKLDKQAAMQYEMPKPYSDNDDDDDG
jgi:hypothetical protein